MISLVCCTLPAGSPGFAHGNWRLVSIAPAAFSYPRAKATEGKAGMAGDTRPRKTFHRRTGLRVGEADAVLPATSEFMDVTAGETAPNFLVALSPLVATWLAVRLAPEVLGSDP